MALEPVAVACVAVAAAANAARFCIALRPERETHTQTRTWVAFWSLKKTLSVLFPQMKLRTNF